MDWLKHIFHRGDLYRDLSDEIEQHIEEKAAQFLREGMSRDEALRAARRAFGNVALLEERGREVWQWSALESLLADVRLAFRRLRKSPGFAATVLLTLAIGIGANTAVFSVIDSVLLKPLPYPGSGRLAALWLNAPGAGGLANFSSGLQISPSMYFTFSRHNRTFESIGIWAPRLSNVTGIAQPEEVKTELVSGGVLEALEVPPVAGRWFSQTDQDPRGAKSVMLGYGYWQRRFGGDRGVIGRTIQVDAESRQIVGVMPRGFRLVDRDFDLLIPMALDPVHQKLAPFGYNGIGRLKPGVTLAEADADIARLIPVWMDSWTNGPGSNPHYYDVWRITPAFRSLKQQVIGNISGVLWVVMATVGLVMLIACSNITNLLLVRADSREEELAIRTALGASRGRIARELLVESLLLSLMGGALSVGVAWAGLRMLVANSLINLPRQTEISLDARSLGFMLLVAAGSGLVFGFIPAWRYSQAHGSILTETAGRSVTANRGRQYTQRLLVIAQVAMAVVLLVSALLMIRTFMALRNVDPGFADAGRVQTMRVSIPDLLIGDPTMVTRTENSIADRLAAVPGVSSVGVAAAVPMENIDPNWDLIYVEGKDYGGGEPPLHLYNYVSPGYFHSMGTRIVAGRDFTWADIYGVRPVVMVSENFARESWGSAPAAIGKRVRQFSSRPWLEVIGVVQDVRHNGVDETAPTTIYWPLLVQNPYASQPPVTAVRAVTFAIHSSRAGNAGFLEQIERAVWSVNANLPVASMSTMQDIYGQSMARTSFVLAMLAIAGIMALALSIIGIYGVISYTVSQRTREIGIRLALGAQRNGLSWMFVRSALRMTLAGAAIGVCLAAALTQLIRSLLFGISLLDPLTYAMVPLVLGTVALAASFFPARKAASVDPMQILRAE